VIKRFNIKLKKIFILNILEKRYYNLSRSWSEWKSKSGQQEAHNWYFE